MTSEDTLQIDRRSLLTGVAGGAAALAGCSGDDGTSTQAGTETETATSSGSDGGSTSEEGTPVPPVDVAWQTKTSVIPTDAQFNPFNPSSPAPAAERVLFDQYLRQNLKTGELITTPLCSGVEINGKERVVKLNDDMYWHNGDQVTNEDWEVGHLIGDLIYNIDSDTEPLITGYTLEGDFTIRQQLREEVNEYIYRKQLVTRLQTPRAIFREWANKLQDAEEDGNLKSKKEELLQTRIDEPIGNSPWKLKSRSPGMYKMELHEKHPMADQINNTRLEILASQNKKATQQRFLQNQLDGTLGPFNASQKVYNQLPDHYKVKKLNRPVGPAMHFNHDSEPFDKPAVRRAIGYAIDPVVAANNAINSNPTSTVATGLVNNKKFIGEDFTSNYIDYGRKEFDKAAEELRSEDFTKQNGKWYKPNGDRFKTTIHAPSFWPKQARTLSSHLNEFGIKTDIMVTEAPTFFGEMLPNLDYEGPCLTRWGGGFHPYDNIVMVALGGWMNAQKQYAYDEKQEIPSEIGNLNSEKETFNVFEKTVELGTAQGEHATELIRKLAWTINAKGSVFPIHTLKKPVPLATDDWELPPLDDPDMNVAMPGEWLWRTGKIKAKRE
jgi:peptide/nickel transport system substrate-binding protein